MAEPLTGYLAEAWIFSLPKCTMALRLDGFLRYVKLQPIERRTTPTSGRRIVRRDNREKQLESLTLLSSRPPTQSARAISSKGSLFELKGMDQVANIAKRSLNRVFSTPVHQKLLHEAQYPALSKKHVSSNSL